MDDGDLLERILAGSEEPRDLPLQILKNITENFSPERKIGAGGFGEVYKGVLQNGCYVALKRITVSSHIHTIDDRQFKREVISLLKTSNHPNVVRFLGFCSDSHREVIKEKGSQDVFLAEIRERILCLEHIGNGSLDKHITDELRGHVWNIRYQILRGICEGLQYLHEEKHIIHMDLKPTNIMVDSDMVPKITDFGLSRPDEKSRTTGERFGSRGYCAPEYDNSGMTSFKCDIYSLGVIISELVTGRKGIPDKNNVFRRWRHRWNREAMHTPLQYQQVAKCIEIAERCMQNEPKERPSISVIIQSLDEIGNKKCQLSDQISASSSDDMLGIDPLELHFAFEHNKEILRKLELTNGTDNCIAFNIETESQLLYWTKPNKGIVPSRRNCTVEITLQAQKMIPGHMHDLDEFIVQSVKVEDGLTDKDITEHMFKYEAGKVVDEVNVTIVYDEYNKQRVEPLLELASSKEINSSSHKDARGEGIKRLNFHPPQIDSSPNTNCLYKASDRAVDLMTGAMGSLLPKLRQLLDQEHNLQTSVKKDVESLEEQLADMHIALCNVSQEQLHQLDPQDKRWANKVRELSYDIEDIVDGLLLCIERSEPIANQQDGFWGLTRKMFKLINWGKTLYHFGRTIEDIKIRVKKVADGHGGIKLGINSVANLSAASCVVDPRLLDFYTDHEDLVGIDGPWDELAKRLTGGGYGVSEQQLKIISIFGDGGLGKTTLAKALYDKLDAKFLLKAFVPVGRNSDVKAVLENILFDLDKKTYAEIRTRRWTEKNLIDEIRDVLRNKRYLIVIDDIWDIPSWEIIKRALIDSKCGSKIITTSRIFEVAKRSGEVCKLEPLPHKESKELFCARLFGHKGGACSFDLPDDESTEYILQKCGGVPLAIITMASLLASKPRDDWPKVYSSIGFGNEDNTDVSNTRQILLFSYYDLPWHLKTCLLYLSIFPEDSEIEKDTLVWRWVAQGFVHEEPGTTLFKVGERYFHELINRSMIQPVERGIYAICACRVHDMVLDMICSMAKEENFVAILGSDEQRLSSQRNGRILAVQNRVLEQHDLASMLKPTVRTFNATWCHISCMMSLLQSFQVLRVLSLEGCTLIADHTTYHPLTKLSGLVHLRYLGLRRTRLGEAAEGYQNRLEGLSCLGSMGDLRFLQTLDLRLRDTKIEALPQSVTLLRQLKCLRADGVVLELPAGMGKLTSLEELQLYLPADSLNFGKELGELTELRVLHIYAHSFRESWNDALMQSLSKLRKIEELVIIGHVFVSKRHDWDGVSPSGQLRRLDLDMKCKALPVWINASLVPNLSHLDVSVRSVEASDLHRLGSLPKLRSLSLSTSGKPFHAVVPAGAFPRLRSCNLSHLLLTCQRRAMPCLCSLQFSLHVRDLKDANFEFQGLDSLVYLPLLQKVVATIDCWDAKKEEVQEAEAAVKHAIASHPNCPILYLDTSGPCSEERMQQYAMIQRLLRISQHQQSGLTDQQSSNDEGQQGAGEQEGSDSTKMQVTD